MRDIRDAERVSIHAPAGGATIGRCSHRLGIVVSIHAPAGGATINPTVSTSRSRCFNPRPRRGGDHHSHGVRRLGLAVSIHAPAGGATKYFSGVTMRKCCFNPRPRRGGDVIPLSLMAKGRSFNPRPRRGGDAHIGFRPWRLA